MLAEMTYAEASLLAKYAVMASGAHKLSTVLEKFGKIVSEAASRLVATVTVAPLPLSSFFSATSLRTLEAFLAPRSTMAHTMSSTRYP